LQNKSKKEKVIIEKGRKKFTQECSNRSIEDKFYFQRVAQALEHYSDNVMNDAAV
jgi:hypothetical protein